MDSISPKIKPRTILVVDDEPDLVKLLSFNLTREGYTVRTASSGIEAVDSALAVPPDLIILDVMLPGLDGLDVCRRLRSNTATAAIPIIMLSARREELDKVLGLELGADDYLVKPFSVRELVARVRALLRRIERDTANSAAANIGGSEDILKSGEITIYPERYQVEVQGKNCALTHKEFNLLHLLMANPGRVLTRELLLEKVWGYEAEVDTRTVDVHIRYLRQKIEQDPARPDYIETVRSVGYRFAAPVSPRLKHTSSDKDE